MQSLACVTSKTRFAQQFGRKIIKPRFFVRLLEFPCGCACSREFHFLGGSMVFARASHNPKIFMNVTSENITGIINPSVTNASLINRTILCCEGVRIFKISTQPKVRCLSPSNFSQFLDTYASAVIKGRLYRQSFSRWERLAFGSCIFRFVRLRAGNHFRILANDQIHFLFRDFGRSSAKIFNPQCTRRNANDSGEAYYQNRLINLGEYTFHRQKQPRSFRVRVKKSGSSVISSRLYGFPKIVNLEDPNENQPSRRLPANLR
jgi:hypothetical protein